MPLPPSIAFILVFPVLKFPLKFGEYFGLILFDCNIELLLVALLAPAIPLALLPLDALKFFDSCMIGDVLNFRINDGDIGRVSDGLMLTETGRDNASDFDGILSGGPIGLSSRFRFFFFSSLSRSSDFLLLLLPLLELPLPDMPHRLSPELD